MKRQNEKLKRRFDQCGGRKTWEQEKNVFVVCGFGSRRQ